MKPKLICVSISHQTAALEVRERLHLDDSLANSLAALLESEFRSFGAGFVAFSTCNRTEIYGSIPGDAVTESGPMASSMQQAVVKQLEESCKLEGNLSDDQFESFVGEEVFIHLARLASGLESELIGETHILGQLKNVLRRRQSQLPTRQLLAELFQKAIASGKRVQTETDAALLFSGLARRSVNYALESLGSLTGKRVWVIGNGKIGSLCVKQFLSQAVARVYVTTRDMTNVIENSSAGSQPVPTAENPMEHADIIVACTNAREAVLSAQPFNDALQRSSKKHVVLIDLGVPRNIDPAIGAMQQANLIHLNRLRSHDAHSFRVDRQQVIRGMESIVAEEVQRFRESMLTTQKESGIARFRTRAEAIRREEFRRLEHSLVGLDSQTRDLVQRFSQSLTNRLLHRQTLEWRGNDRVSSKS